MHIGSGQLFLCGFRAGFVSRVYLEPRLQSLVMVRLFPSKTAHDQGTGYTTKELPPTFIYQL